MDVSHLLVVAIRLQKVKVVLECLTFLLTSICLVVSLHEVKIDGIARGLIASHRLELLLRRILGHGFVEYKLADFDHFVLNEVN